MSDLGETGGGEDAAAADVELDRHDVVSGFGDHRIALDRARAAFACEVDSGARQLTLIPRRRKPARVTKHVTAQTPSSVLSSARSAQGTRVLSSNRGYAVRGSIAHQPTGSRAR